MWGLGGGGFPPGKRRTGPDASGTAHERVHGVVRNRRDLRTYRLEGWTPSPTPLVTDLQQGSTAPETLGQLPISLADGMMKGSHGQPGRTYAHRSAERSSARRRREGVKTPICICLHAVEHLIEAGVDDFKHVRACVAPEAAGSSGPSRHTNQIIFAGSKRDPQGDRQPLARGL